MRIFSRPAVPGLLPGERVYISIREHWIRLVLRLLLWLIFVTPVVAFHYLAPTNLPFLFQGELAKVTELVLQVYYLFLILALFILWLLYYLNLHIITNVRIIDIDQVGLFRHILAELHVDKVEDVTSDTAGFLGNVFNYGNVYVQTAATTERFAFDNVPNPAAIVKLILDLYERENPPKPTP